jgi:hypothetical protein
VPGKTRTPFGVAKFLNRLLGMNMKRQGLVFDYFVKTLDEEIRSAKSFGIYDVGIKTLKGQSLTFNKHPQSFCFRGLTAPHESVELYAVQQDKGMTPEAAMELYNSFVTDDACTSNADEDTDALADSPNQLQGWVGSRRRGGRRSDFVIQTGFYVSFSYITHRLLLIH